MTELAKPKKQFKSQSVNSLFRQQTQPQEVAEKKSSRSPTPNGTKKLVARKRFTAKKVSHPTTPTAASPLVKTTSVDVDPLEPEPLEDSLWEDLHSRIIDEARTRSSSAVDPFAALSSSDTWSSPPPTSQLSGFRGPFLQAASQSPLSKPHSESRLFSAFQLQHAPSEPKLSSFNNTPLDRQWSSSPNIWNLEDRALSTKSESALPWTHNLSIDTPSLDDPLQMQHQLSLPFDSSAAPTPQSRNGSKTSRFFPSPSVPQNPSFDQFPRQPSSGPGFPGTRISFENVLLSPPPTQPQFIPPPPPLQQQQPQLTQQQYTPPPPPPTAEEEYIALEMEPSSQPMDSEAFADHFDTTHDISVSLYNSHDYYPAEEPHSSNYRSNYLHEQQSYPEGFASTFYKRGANNFMFIRELQPKLVTSKHRDTVEVRVSLPTISKEGDSEETMIKMRCHIVNVDVRDLEGRIGGIKVGKPQGTRGRGRGGYRGRRS